MKNKLKTLICIICSLVVIVASAVLLLVIKKTNITANGNINFVSENVYATISSGVINNAEFAKKDGEKLSGFEIVLENRPAQSVSAIETWKNLEFYSKTTKDGIVISFFIKNNSTVVNEYIKATTSIVKNEKSENSQIIIEPSYSIIDPNASQLFVIYFSAENHDKNANIIDFDITINLQKTNDKPGYKTLSFDVGNAENKDSFAKTVYQENSIIETLENPVMQNKMFEGWYLDGNFQTRATFPLTIENDTTLYAKFVDTTLQSASFKYDETTDSYIVVKNTTEGYVLPEIIVVPDVYNGTNGLKPVTQIADGETDATTVFGNNSVVKQIYFGNNISYLGSGVARKATALEKVVMQDSITKTSEVGYLFYGCVSLTDMTYSKGLDVVSYASFRQTGLLDISFLPNTIKKLDKYAFAMCENMTEITIPQNIKEIGVFGFARSAKLETVNLHSNVDITNRCFWDTPFENNNLNKAVPLYDNPNNKILIKASNDIVSTTEIENYDKITHVLGGAFMNIEASSTIATNTTLKTIDLPKLEYVGQGAFYNCTQADSLIAPNVTYVGNSAFYQCEKIKTVDMPKLENIDWGGFNYCKGLETINMPSVKYIGVAAFQYCTSLVMELPEGVLWLGDFSYNHCQKSTQKTITIPSTVVQMGGREFIGDNNSNYIVGTHIFYDCATASLEEFVVAEGNPYFETHQGVLYTKDCKIMIAYPAAKTATAYEVPEGCLEMFELSFSRPHFLKTLTLPNSLVVRRACTQEFGYNHPDMNNISNALYHYAAVDKIIIKDDNPDYKSIDGVVYTKDGKELIAVPTAYARGGSLTFAESCETINCIPFFYALSTEITYNEQKVGKGPTQIIIGENIKQISELALNDINSYNWTIVSNSPYYEVVEGKLVQK